MTMFIILQPNLAGSMEKNIMIHSGRRMLLERGTSSNGKKEKISAHFCKFF